MLRFYIKQTDEYERLIEFLKPMGLEFSDEEIERISTALKEISQMNPRCL